MTLGHAAQAQEVLLPGGLWLSGGDSAPLRSVRLRAVNDEDRVWLLGTRDVVAMARRASELLARCTDIAEHGDPAALSVGDREALLLNLHRVTFGETLECVLRCPRPGCDQRMELAPLVSDMLVAPYEAPRAVHELLAEDGGATYRIAFRLPSSEDLDTVAATASVDVERAARTLLARCVRAAMRDGDAIDFEELPQALRDALAREMQRLDPQAQVELDVSCPTCGHAFDVLFDAASFLLRELDADAARLLGEIHVLATSYGWSEHDILAIPAVRRACYIELIAERVAARTS
jgi:hypothetical protein